MFITVAELHITLAKNAAVETIILVFIVLGGGGNESVWAIKVGRQDLATKILDGWNYFLGALV
jgi:hypothetical protein